MIYKEKKTLYDFHQYIRSRCPEKQATARTHAGIKLF